MTKDIILEQFGANYNQSGWFVNVTRAIDGLTPEQAEWKNEAIGHSVFQLVNHITFWTERYLVKFNGGQTAKMQGSNDDTFANPDDLSWPEAIVKLNEVMTGWEKAIKSANEEKLGGPFIPGKDATWYSVIAHMNGHNSYHIGEIVVIRKLQGSWDTTKGVG